MKQDNFIVLHHCDYCAEPTQAQCAHRTKDKVTGVTTACQIYFCHLCIQKRLSSMHVSKVLRMVAMCTCELHYSECLKAGPPNHGISNIKNDIDGKHYDGEAYVWAPPSTLENHVKQTVSLAAGPSGMNVDVLVDHKEKDVDRKVSTDDKKLITRSRDKTLITGDKTLITVKTEIKPEKPPDCGFPPPEMLRLLNLACSDEYQLPEKMVNFKGAIRNGKGNSTFLHNYFGITLWQYLSGKCWVKHNQLHMHANQWDCNRLISLCKTFLHAEPILGRKLLGSLPHVDTNKLTSFCSTTRNKNKVHGTYDSESDSKDGIYEKHYELLSEIGFEWK